MSPRKFWVIVAAIFIGLGLLINEDERGSTTGSVSGQVVSFDPVDEANLGVWISFKNDGDSPAKVQCDVVAKDASGITVGTAGFETPDFVEPEKARVLNAVFRIKDLGAYRVRRVEIESCDAL